MMKDDEATVDRSRSGFERATGREPGRFSDETFSARAAASPSNRLETTNGQGAITETDAEIEENPDTASDAGWVIETVVSPFHCLYQDALALPHAEPAGARSESEASRLARAALLLYVSSAEALVHQAAARAGPARAARHAGRP